MHATAAKWIATYFPWEHGHRREFLRNFLLQIYFTFIQSLMMLAVLGLCSGIAIAFQANLGLSLLGTNDQLGKLLVIIVFREVTPLAAGLLLIARSVTAVASEMATIKVQQEIEALQIMGINVYHYLLAPRITAGMVSLFCMAATFWGFALLGGYFGANVNGYYPVSQYVTSIAQSLRTWDLLFFVLKTMIVGGVVIRTACQRGLSLQNAPFEVPIVTNRAVVDSLTLGMGIHFFLSAVYYVAFGVDI
jgi:phospholipid/cholesterol/gamma-HCH transport system permease protein